MFCRTVTEAKPDRPYCTQLTLATWTDPSCAKLKIPEGRDGNCTGPSWKVAELTLLDAKLVPPAEGTDVAGVVQMVALVEPHMAVMLLLGVPPPRPPLQTGSTSR